MVVIHWQHKYYQKQPRNHVPYDVNMNYISLIFTNSFDTMLEEGGETDERRARGDERRGQMKPRQIYVHRCRQPGGAAGAP